MACFICLMGLIGVVIRDIGNWPRLLLRPMRLAGANAETAMSNASSTRQLDREECGRLQLFARGRAVWQQLEPQLKEHCHLQDGRDHTANRQLHRTDANSFVCRIRHRAAGATQRIDYTAAGDLALYPHGIEHLNTSITAGQFSSATETEVFFLMTMLKAIAHNEK